MSLQWSSLLVNSVDAPRFIDFWRNGRNLTVILGYIERGLLLDLEELDGWAY